jgi:hypothetical protein
VLFLIITPSSFLSFHDGWERIVWSPDFWREFCCALGGEFSVRLCLSSQISLELWIGLTGGFKFQRVIEVLGKQFQNRRKSRFPTLCGWAGASRRWGADYLPAGSPPFSGVQGRTSRTAACFCVQRGDRTVFFPRCKQRVTRSILISAYWQLPHNTDRELWFHMGVPLSAQDRSETMQAAIDRVMTTYGMMVHSRPSKNRKPENALEDSSG